MNLARAFALSAKQDLTKTALFWGEDEFSYGTFLDQSLWVAAALQERHNVKPGDRVGIWLKNCPQFVPAFFGILAAGAVVTPINNFLKPAEVGFILADAGINVLITDDSMSEGFEKLRVDAPQLTCLKVNDLPSQPARLRVTPSVAESDSLAVLIYTSGTTGHPKGAMLTHANLLANVESCRRVLEVVGEDRFVVLLPMFHSFMMTVCVLLPMLVGGSIVLIKSVHPPKNIVSEILRHRATLLPAVPQFFRTFIHGELPADFPLRLCISGGAPLPAEIWREFTAKFSVPLLEGYGLSEASPVVSFNPIRGGAKPGSIGVPIHGVEVSVQSDTGELLPTHQTGEICVRGANVMQGYWNQPEETARVFRDGWLLTGDIGHCDGDGFFYITDRKKDMLLVNGINVYPREIEEVLYRFPGVKEAAVIGVPDARKGEQPWAFIAAGDGVTLDEKQIQQFVRERLADYKVPRQIEFLTALPRTATGKILKTELRRKAQSQG